MGRLTAENGNPTPHHSPLPCQALIVVILLDMLRKKAKIPFTGRPQEGIVRIAGCALKPLRVISLFLSLRRAGASLN
jgi:hypothetical protein